MASLPRKRPRRSRPRSYVISFKRMAAEVRAARIESGLSKGQLEVFDRPKTRGDCLPCEICQAVRDGVRDDIDSLPCGHKDDEIIWHSRPCVFVGCRKNLYLDVTDNGSLKLTRPELEPEAMRETRSCVLDVAATGPLTLDDVGVVLDVSRERVRQLEVKAIGDTRIGIEAAGIDAEAVNDFPDREQGYDGDAGEGLNRLK